MIHLGASTFKLHLLFDKNGMATRHTRQPGTFQRISFPFLEYNLLTANRQRYLPAISQHWGNQTQVGIQNRYQGLGQIKPGSPLLHFQKGSRTLWGKNGNSRTIGEGREDNDRFRQI